MKKNFVTSLLLLSIALATLALPTLGLAQWDEQRATANSKIPPYAGRERLHLDVEQGQYKAVVEAIRIYQTILEKAPADYADRDAVTMELIHAAVLAGVDCAYRGFEREAHDWYALVLKSTDEELKKYPAYFWLHYKKGIAARALGDDAAAAKSFGQAVSTAQAAIDQVVDGNAPEAEDILHRAQIDYAGSLAAIHDYPGATKLLEQLKANDAPSQREETHRLIGQLLIAQGKRTEALHELKEAAESAVEEVYAIEPQLWSWLFSPTAEERKPIAESLGTLAKDFPFADYGLQWDRPLLTFIAGTEKLTPEALLEALTKEETRRHGSAGVEIAALRVRTWFVIGAWYDQHGETAKALDAYKKVQLYSLYGGKRFYWEAVHAAARLAATAHPTPTSSLAKNIPDAVVNQSSLLFAS